MRRALLLVIMVGYAGMCLWGIDWGLSSALREQCLFPGDSVWSPQLVSDIRAEAAPPEAELGADVDPNPTLPVDWPIRINETEEEIAEIYSRFLLYSNQPDEMITFRALGQMDPGHWQLDPKLYQYGGLFIYPLGGLIKLAMVGGLIEPGGLDHFLTTPREFTKFYILGRATVATWGLLGIWIVYALGQRLCDWRSGLLAALLFAMLPVVTSLSHESKPHLPGAVLMLWATLWALKYIESGRVLHRFMLAVSSGLALGMVLSSLWILVLIPLAEFLTRSSTAERMYRSTASVALSLIVYAITNPYVAINLLNNRGVLFSNLGNSTAMYHVARLDAGFLNAVSLVVEGSSALLGAFGVLMLIALWGRDWRRAAILVLPAIVVFAQFAALAADKPGEYGRFGILPCAILCVVVAVGVFQFLVTRWYQSTIYSLVLATLLALPTLDYLESFHRDRTEANTRYELAATLESQFHGAIGVLRDPAPYGFPPIDFSSHEIVLLPPDISAWPANRSAWPHVLVVPLNGVEGVDVEAIIADGFYETADQEPLPIERTPMTWADKPLLMLTHGAGAEEL